MRAAIVNSLVMLAVMTLLTGILYPLAVTGIAALVFPRASRGSLIVRRGEVIGSSLIGQPFTAPGYFWGRPSATIPPDNGGASGGSDLGPTNPALADSIRARIERLRRADPQNEARIPVDLVTSSASGCDPDITPEAAEFQVPRVARARGLPEAQVRDLVRRRITPRQFGILGERRVNVLELNLALDALQFGGGAGGAPGYNGRGENR